MFKINFNFRLLNQAFYFFQNYGAKKFLCIIHVYGRGLNGNSVAVTLYTMEINSEIANVFLFVTSDYFGHVKYFLLAYSSLGLIH